jgi:hypothetical protein
MNRRKSIIALLTGLFTVFESAEVQGQNIKFRDPFADPEIRFYGKDGSCLEITMHVAQHGGYLRVARGHEWVKVPLDEIMQL